MIARVASSQITKLQDCRFSVRPSLGLVVLIKCLLVPLLPGVAVQAGVEIHKIETPGETLTGQALSGDGLVVVGTQVGTPGQPFRWTVAGGYELLAAPTHADHQGVRRVNTDGTAFVGGYGAGGTGYLWQQSGGYTNILGASGRIAASPHGISGNGTIVVGDANTTGTGFYCFRWLGGSYTVFDVPEALTTYTAFFDVSADGRYACANGQVPSSVGDRRIFRHDFNTGLRAVLGASNFRWTASAMSADGNVITGRTANNAVNPYRWNITTTGLTYLGSLDPGLPAIPNDLSGDGSVIVGRSLTATGDKAFVWDDTGGIRSLETYIVEKGGDLSGWTFSEAKMISDDGDAILATGTSSNPLEFSNGPVLITGLNQPVLPTAELAVSTNGLNYEISFETVDDQEYWLQGSATPGAPSWSDETVPVAGTGALMTLTVPRANYPQGSYFFRVATQAAP